MRAMSLLALFLLLSIGRALPYTEPQPSREEPAHAPEKVARLYERGRADAPPATQRKRANSRAGRKRYSRAPEIIIIGLDGKNILLYEKRGKVMVVDFWASWCPPCRTMIPIFNSLQEKYRNRGLEVIGVSMDEGTTADLKELSAEFGLRYTAADGDSETEKAFRVEALPTTLLIDRKGRIRSRHRGAISQAKLEAEIKRLLSE